MSEREGIVGHEGGHFDGGGVFRAWLGVGRWVGGGGGGGGGGRKLVDFFAHDGERGPAVHGPGPIYDMNQSGDSDWADGIAMEERETYAPQRAMSVVANWNEVEKGARIIEAANANCEIPQAVVMSIRYRSTKLAVRGLFPWGLRASSSEGKEIKKGKKTELAKDITENMTKAKEPFRAISPTMSVDVFNSAALSAFWR